MLSDETERLVAVAVRKVSGLQVKKAKNAWKRVEWWVGVVGVGSCLEVCPYGLEEMI